MGLFDNLFKNKPDSQEEDVVEAARRITETGKARLVEAEKASKTEPAHKTPGSGNRAAHAPVARAYSPRSLGQAVAPRQVPAGRVPGRPMRFSPAGEAGRPHEIRLTLDDILPRIPPDLLNDGARDGRKEIRFRVEDVTADIARGRAAVALARIAEQVPEIFKEQVSAGDETLIRLPLQKLVEQIGFLPVKAASEAKPLQPAAPPAVKTPHSDSQHGAVASASNKPAVSSFSFSSEGTGSATGAPLPGDEPARTRRQTPEPSVPAPDFQSAGFGGDARISLGLRAVLQECPKEVICGSLPPIRDTDQITLPFASIEKQLRTGQVDISSVRFVFALPVHLQRFFEAREGVRIPLPMDEILRNLPDIGTALSGQPPDTVQNESSLPAPAEHTPEEQPASNLPSPTPISTTAVATDIPAPAQNSSLDEPELQKVEEPFEVVTSSRAAESPLDSDSSEQLPSNPEQLPSNLDPAAPNEDSPRAQEDGVLESTHSEDPNSTPKQQFESGLSVAADAVPTVATLLPAETTLDVPAPVLSSPEISLSVPRAAIEEAATVTPEAAAEPASPPVEAHSPEPAVPDPESRLPASLAAVRPPLPTMLPSIPPPPVLGSGSPSEATPEVGPIELPVVSRFIPPSVHLPATLSPFVAPPDSVDKTADRPTSRTEVGGESAPAAEAPPFRRDSSVSPFIPPPVFPMPPPPVLPGGGPPSTRDTSHIDPPPSPILPVRMVSPPVLRPLVAPPPLFGSGVGEDQPVAQPAFQIPVEAAPPEPPPPAPPAPRPLALEKARHLAGLEDDAPLGAIGESLIRLPGLHGCLLTVRNEIADVGKFPEGFDKSGARALAARLAESVRSCGDDSGLGQVQHVTAFIADGCLSVFTRGNAVICALHRTRAFLPGVCEKLSAMAEALADA